MSDKNDIISAENSAKFQQSSTANATTDSPKTQENTPPANPTRLTKKEQLELELDKRDSEDSKTQSNLAFKIFIILLVFLVLLIIISVVLHCLNIPELRVLENCIVFCQGALTTILGFLFGTKIHRKKM